MRSISYQEAIKEALRQAMSEDERVFIMGQGLDSPWSFGGSTLGLINEFGKKRVYDITISEAGLTGVAIGAAISGMRPIVMHPRVDFMYLAMDQIANHASNWHYMFGGRVNVPVVIRGVVNRGNEQAAQHSQSPHAMFAHLPGLKVVMPGTPKDAKGLLLAAIDDPDPVIYIDERWLYLDEGEVPEEPYITPIGKAEVLRAGHDITLVTVSYLINPSLDAAEELEKEGVSVEVIDIRTLKPLDHETIFESVRKTGRVVVADSGWLSFGSSAEIAAKVSEACWSDLKHSPVRIASPDTPVPASVSLEKGFFLGKDDIISALRRCME